MGKNYYTLYVVSDDVSQKVLDKLKGADSAEVRFQSQEGDDVIANTLVQRKMARPMTSLVEYHCLKSRHWTQKTSSQFHLHMWNRMSIRLHRKFSHRSRMRTTRCHFSWHQSSRVLPRTTPPSYTSMLQPPICQKDSILAFTFYPVTAPTKPEEIRYSLMPDIRSHLSRFCIRIPVHIYLNMLTSNPDARTDK